jgi:aspartokinase/homoserine dehydrogenase 1
MKVLKFGGTSVGSVNSILSVKKIVEAIEEPVIVVVSALGGITDKLLATSAMASKGDISYEKEFSEIITRHLDVIEGVIPDVTKRKEVQKLTMSLLDELGNIFVVFILSTICLPKLQIQLLVTENASLHSSFQM